MEINILFFNETLQYEKIFKIYSLKGCTDRRTGGQLKIRTNKQKDKLTHKHVYKHTNEQTDKLTDGQTDKRKDG